MNEQKSGSKGKQGRQTRNLKISTMEVSIIMLLALIVGFGVAALKALVKQHKRNSKEDFKYKNL